MLALEDVIENASGLVTIEDKEKDYTITDYSINIDAMEWYQRAGVRRRVVKEVYAYGNVLIVSI